VPPQPVECYFRQNIEHTLSFLTEIFDLLAPITSHKESAGYDKSDELFFQVSFTIDDEILQRSNIHQAHRINREFQIFTKDFLVIYNDEVLQYTNI
jgi:hypothetical protein